MEDFVCFILQNEENEYLLYKPNEYTGRNEDGKYTNCIFFPTIKLTESSEKEKQEKVTELKKRLFGEDTEEKEVYWGTSKTPDFCEKRQKFHCYNFNKNFREKKFGENFFWSNLNQMESKWVKLEEIVNPLLIKMMKKNEKKNEKKLNFGGFEIFPSVHVFPLKSKTIIPFHNTNVVLFDCGDDCLVIDPGSNGDSLPKWKLLYNKIQNKFKKIYVKKKKKIIFYFIFLFFIFLLFFIILFFLLFYFLFYFYYFYYFLFFFYYFYYFYFFLFLFFIFSVCNYSPPHRSH